MSGQTTSVAEHRPHQRVGDVLSLADELFVLAVDPVTGRLIVHGRPLALALSAGLLFELVLSGHAVICEGEVLVTRSAPPAAAVGGSLLVQLHSHVARDNSGPPGERATLAGWLRWLASNAESAVSSRLEAAGRIRCVRSTGLVAAGVFEILDGPTRDWIPHRLARPIGDQKVIGWEDTALITIADAAGLGGLAGRSSRHHPEPTSGRLAFYSEFASGWRDLSELLTALRGVIAEEAVASR
jgi:hypothetical protein